MHSGRPHMVYVRTFPGFVFFAANPMMPSFNSTVVGGNVLSRSPRRRPSDTATLKDHADSLPDKLLLGAETIHPHTIETVVGIRPARFL